MSIEMKIIKKLFLITSIISCFSSINSFAGSFIQTPQGTKYDWGNGNYCVDGWVQSNDHWYYFGDDGFMRTGWIQRDNTWYFASDTGELNSGIMKINGNVYFFDKATCALVTGPIDFLLNTYTFTENGVTGETPYIYTEWNSDGSIKTGEKYNIVKMYNYN